MSTELYSILGVASDATDDEIKRAYFRKVREHSPEQDPEHFKLIRSAYETLSDANARRDYDTMQQYGGEIHELLEEAEAAMELGEWDEAIRRFKRILVLHPESNAARNSLGICYMQDEQHEAAVKIFSQLVERSPNSVAYWMGLGFAWLHGATELTEHSAGWRDGLGRAQDAFEHAVELEPMNSDAHKGVATVRREFEDWEGAAEWLESAVSADGETDLHDFDALEQLCVVYVISEQLPSLKDTLQRLVSIAPDDEEAREYMVDHLGMLGGQMAEAGRFSEASVAFEYALKLRPGDASIEKARQVCADLGAATQEWERFKDDDGILDAVRAIVALRLAAEHGSSDVSEYRYYEVLEAINTWPRSRVRSSVARIRTRYPASYSLAQPLLETLVADNHGVAAGQAVVDTGAGCAAGLVRTVLIWGGIALLISACGMLDSCS